MSTSTEDEPPEDRMMDIHPTSSTGGVFSSRTTQRKVPIHGSRATNTKEMDLEVASVSDSPEVEERDFHSKQVTWNCLYSGVTEYTDHLRIGFQRMDSSMVSDSGSRVSLSLQCLLEASGSLISHSE